MRPLRPAALALLVLTATLAGCADDPSPPPADPTPPPPAAEPFTFLLSEVGVPAPEPSVGITSSGCIFVTADHRVMRSCDHGATWEESVSVLNAPQGNDPYLWVDPVTDRVFNLQMQNLACTWISWSDDDGASWVGNPADCGPVPVNDHIKLATGAWVGGLGPLGMNPAYPQAVYFCYNKLVAVFCYTSLDGGASFTVGGRACNGGLHGAIEAAPDGTVYVPPRLETPTVCISKDNGLTWTTVAMGEDAGTPEPRKNSEVATDAASNAYHVWVGSDFGVYLSRSTDGGATWDATSLRVSPAEVASATFPHVDAGDPGRVAIAYLGSEDYEGNPHTADEDAHFHMYVTFSTDALSPAPTWTTRRITSDPVQVGSICINSGDCSDGNRNLLDFNDLHIDREGRVHVAFADGCTGDCATDAAAGPGDSRDRLGVVAIQQTGPSLYAAVGELAPPAPPAPPA